MAKITTLCYPSMTSVIKSADINSYLNTYVGFRICHVGVSAIKNSTSDMH